MAVWLRSFFIWTSLMSTTHANAYRSYDIFGGQYDADSGAVYPVVPHLRSLEPKPTEVAFSARSVASDSNKQKIEKETERRTGTSSLLMLLLDGIVSEMKTTLADEIVFPGPTTNTKPQSSFVPVVPNECKRMGFCEKADGYPTDHVNELLKSGRNFSFNVDELEVTLVQRLGATDQEMCKARERIIPMTIAQNSKNKWYYIVNNAEGAPVQGFRGQICDLHGSPCSDVARFSLGYMDMCVQKYMLRYMYALDENGNMFRDSFRVPSCCSCIVRNLR